MVPLLKSRDKSGGNWSLWSSLFLFWYSRIHLLAFCKVYFKWWKGSYEHSPISPILQIPWRTLLTRKMSAYCGLTVCQTWFQLFMRCSSRFPEPPSMTLYLKEGSLFWGLGLAFVTVTIKRMYRGKNTHAELFGSMILLFWEGVSTSQKAAGCSMAVLNACALWSLLHAGEGLSRDLGLSFPEMILVSERERPLYLQTENLIHLKSKSCIGRKKWVEYQ